MPSGATGQQAHRSGRIAAVIVLAAAVAGLAVVANAAKTPSQLSQACRARIADQAKSALGKNLTVLDTCHRTRDQGKRADDCNALPFTAEKLAAKVQEKCPAGEPVLANYGGGDPAARIVSVFDDEIQASGAALQGGPALIGDKQAGKCRDAIGKARSKIVKDVVAAAVKCQKATDKGASSFGPLAAACATAPSAKLIASVSKSITKACRRKVASNTFTPITGASVGSCDPLPGCVVTAAAATAATLAGTIYKTPAVCGDGALDVGEACDPGADVATDCCSAACALETAGVTCRTAAGVCDIPETCTGASALCPLDQKSTEVCQPAADPCGAASVCDGASNDCPSPADALAKRMRAADPNRGTFVSRTFVSSRGSSQVRFGTVTKTTKPPAGNLTAPKVSLRTSSVAPGGGRQFGVVRKTTTTQNAARGGLAAPDRLWVVAGPANAECVDVFDVQLPANDEDLDFEAELAADLAGGGALHVQFALGDATGPLTAYETLALQPSGFFRQVGDIRPGAGGSNARAFTAVGDTVFFVADENANEPRIWRSNAGEAGPIDVSPVESDIVLRDLAAVDSELFFTRCALGESSCGLFSIDGTSESPTLVAESVKTFCGDGTGSGNHVAERAAVGSLLYFTSDSRFTDGGTEASPGCELWSSSSAGTTALVRDIRSGPSGSFPRHLTPAGNALLFVASDGAALQVWQSNGTAMGTTPLTTFDPGADPINELVVAGGAYFFVRNEGALWMGALGMAPTPIGPFTKASNLTAVGDTLFLTACDLVDDCELWSKAPGEPLQRVRDVDPSGSGDPDHLTAVGNLLFFSATDGTTGRELWRSNGSEGGTVRVRDIVADAGSSNPTDLVDVGGTLVFVATDGTRGRELWQSDGTDAGTDRIRDFAAGSGNASLKLPIVSAGEVGYLTIEDNASGAEPYAVQPFVAAAGPTPTPTAAPTPDPTPTITPGVGSCCVGRSFEDASASCEVGGCAACVCAFDPYCCFAVWDGVCATEAAEQCGGECPCAATPTPTPLPTATPEARDCCAAHAGAGCQVLACQECVCTADPFCCDNTWDEFCGREASGDLPQCNAACAVCLPPTPTADPTPSPTPTPILGSCCAPHAEPGCEVSACATCVCARDPYCCGQEWDSLCVGEASGGFAECSAACEICTAPATPTPSPTPTPAPTATPIDSNCCTPHGGSGCDVPECQACICNLDGFCCGQFWDFICAQSANGGFPECAADCSVCTAP